MNLQIQRIKQKLQELKKIDQKLTVFGASNHRYELSEVKSEMELTDFESKYKITLPEPYRLFLKEMGNGGAGPYYGIEKLESGIYSDLDYKNPMYKIDPSKEFPFTQAWNLEFDHSDEEIYYKQKDEIYFDEKWANGLLRICNFGCGISINLVVNGSEYGNVWVDDRCNDGGIYPNEYFGNKERTDFLTWYELWLDKSFQDINATKKKSI
jgi:SMI1 / KNR4 family (SUKH-1)